MKKSTKIILIAAVCFLSVGVVISSAGFLAGGSYRLLLGSGLWNSTIHTNTHYDNDWEESGVYRVPALGIDSLSIDWVGGDIKLQSYDGDEILIKEVSDETLNEQNCLRYRVSGGNLSVDYCRDSVAISFSDDEGVPAKKLIVKMPRELATNLSRLSVDTVSSDIILKKLTVEELEISTTSGSIFAEGLKSDSANVDTISGHLKADFLTCPGELYFSSTSGSCRLKLPEDSNALIRFSTASGRFHNEFDSHHGKTGRPAGEGEYYIGSGGDCEISADTVSGDISISH